MLDVPVQLAYPPVSTPPPQYESSSSISNSIPVNHAVDEVYSSDDVTTTISSTTTHMSSYSKQTIQTLQSSSVNDETVTGIIIIASN